MTGSSGYSPEGLFALFKGPAFDRLSRQSVARGTTLIAAGTEADAMYLVETGRFRVERDGVALAEIGAGSVMGEIAFMTGERRTADVIAARASVVCRIDRADYAELCGAEPGLAQAITSELAQRLAATSARVPHDPSLPPLRTYVIVPAAGASLPEAFLSELSARVARHCSVALVTEDLFRSALGAGADPESPEAVAWLNAQERGAEVVIFVASPEASPWSRAAVRQADQALFVADAAGFAPPSDLERMALDLLPENQRRLVLVHPRRLEVASGTAAWLDSRPVFLHHHVAATPDGAEYDRLARFIARRAIGLVMSGGGAFGVVHVGTWNAMIEAGLPVDIVGGTSIGSAMGGAIALGVAPEDVGHRVEQIFVQSGAMRRVTVPRYAFLDHKVLDAALQEHYGDTLIEDLWLPYYAVAADVATMRKHVMRRGPLWEAIRASSSIPGILPAFYTPDGAMLVDGGCIDNLPFRDMHGLKSGPNVIVDVQKSINPQIDVDYRALPGRAELLRRTVLPFGKEIPRAPGVISTVMRSLLVGQADSLSALNPDDLHVRPPGLIGAGFLAWSQHREFYELGYSHATKEFARRKAAGDPAMAALHQAAAP